MLTIIQDIPSVVFSDNNIILKLTSNQYIIQSGLKSSITVTLTTALSGQTFVFNNAGNVITFTGVNTPNDSGLQFKYNATNLALDIVATLNANYIFSTNYVAIYISSTSFKIEAKQPGTAYNFTLGGTLSISTSSAVAGLNYIYQDNYGAIAELWVENTWMSGTFTKVSTQILIPDNLQNVEFNFRNNVKACLRQSIDLPTYGTTVPEVCLYHNRRFYIQYAEQYGTTVSVKKLYKTSIKTAYRGGLSLFESITQFAPLDSSYFYINKKFLSLAPAKKIITKHQHEYLYAYRPSLGAGTFVTLFASFYFTNGTTSLNNPFFIGTPMSDNQINIFPVGYYQLDLETLFPTQQVQSYKVWLSNSISSVVISEVREYVLDLNCYEETPMIIFLNSSGGMETLHLRAYGSKRGSTVQRSLAEKYIPTNYAVTQGAPITGFDNIGTRIIQATTGYHDRKYIEYLGSELLQSEAIFELNNDKYYPVYLKTDELVYSSDMDSLYSFDFEYRHASNDTNPTPIL